MSLQSWFEPPDSCLHTSTEPHRGLFGTKPRPPLQQGPGPLVFPTPEFIGLYSHQLQRSSIGTSLIKKSHPTDRSVLTLKPLNYYTNDLRANLATVAPFSSPLTWCQMTLSPLTRLSWRSPSGATRERSRGRLARQDVLHSSSDDT